jgi:hypothetical protein
MSGFILLLLAKTGGSDLLLAKEMPREGSIAGHAARRRELTVTTHAAAD